MYRNDFDLEALPLFGCIPKLQLIKNSFCFTLTLKVTKGILNWFLCKNGTHPTIQSPQNISQQEAHFLLPSQS
jgi:hypothetical protein